jgi:hypothetical protein
MNFFFGGNRVKNAIQRGLANGELRQELKELGELKLEKRADAEAICWGLEQLQPKSPKLAEQTYALATLFQEIEGRNCAAFEVLQARGIPELLRLFDEIKARPEEDKTDALLFLLKILALYGTVNGTLKIVEAARLPIKPDGYMWSVVLRLFSARHPEKELLFGSLQEPLPEGFIAVSLLDAANAVLIEGDSLAHPFDTPQGRQRLQDWLSDANPDKFSYAHSATAALPFISNPGRDGLLDLALKHPDRGVQIEAAWASAKLGNDDAIHRLAEYCLDYKTSDTAKRYLAELKREDAIPPQAHDPAFAAVAGFAQWLAHPNELGRIPDEIKIADHRVLNWPPERKPKPFWLIQYLMKDTTGLEDDDVECGLVGSITFCFFSYKLAQRPPEDAYAVHCYWEMEQMKLIEESKLEAEADEYKNLLTQWSGPALENPRMQFVAEISPELRYPQRLVGMAAARLNGESGWVILDGSRSEWCPQNEQPKDAYDSVVLKIHVGRNLLGFAGQPDRRKYLATEQPPKPPEQIIAAYEKLLAEAESAEGKQREEAFRTYRPVAKYLGKYLDALQRQGRTGEIGKVIERLAPHWEHAGGYSALGMAAWKCGQTQLAEDFFVKYRDRCANYERAEEMGHLAEIWHRAGKLDSARDLLLDCLRRLLIGSKSAEGADKRLYEEWYQRQRIVFLKLFRDGEKVLAEQSIPSTTRPRE